MGGGLLSLAPGLYQFRITWVDGVVYESYLSLQCDKPRSPGELCLAHRYLYNLREHPRLPERR